MAKTTKRAMSHLNQKEIRLFKQFRASKTAKTIADLAAICWGKGPVGAVRANSWVRNSLRRLVSQGLIVQVGKGTYEITQYGRQRGAELVEGGELDSGLSSES